MHRNFIDLTGKTFNRLTVLGLTDRKTKAGLLWSCKCVCGNVVEVETSRLNNKNVKSCGCLKRETCKEFGEAKIHGFYGQPWYQSWKSMIERCTKMESSNYHNYGGRGIFVCERWLTSPENFLADMGIPPEGTSLDRIDVNGNYESGNCRWATRQEQNSNKRVNVFLTHGGMTKTRTEWSRITGLSISTLVTRKLSGWSDSDALTTPVHKKDKTNKKQPQEGIGRPKTHGFSGTKEYNSWMKMLKRCEDPTNRNYPRYGGRGISVCERWKNIENFMYDMGQCPDGHTLERIDVNGDYTPENCKWATIREQNRNRTSSIWLTYNNQTKLQSEWAKEIGITQAALKNRLDTGWTLEEALSAPQGSRLSSIRKLN